MGKINKAESVVKDLVVKVRREDDYDRSRSVYPYRYRYRGVAYIKGLLRVRLAEVVSDSYSRDSANRCLVVFGPNGKTSRHTSRKDCRDQIRRLRQGTREKVIYQAELTLQRLMLVSVK